MVRPVVRSDYTRGGVRSLSSRQQEAAPDGTPHVVARCMCCCADVDAGFPSRCRSVVCRFCTACVLLRYTSPINGFAVMLWLVVSRACRPSALSYRKTCQSCRRFAADCGTSRCRVLRGRQSRRCCRSSVPSTTPLQTWQNSETSYISQGSTEPLRLVTVLGNLRLVSNCQ